MAMFWLALVTVVLLASMKSVWMANGREKSYISLEKLLVLVCLYVTMALGFGLIYTSLHMNGYEVFIKNIGHMSDEFRDVLQDCLYLSATTLLSVGYGDVIPVGVGRWIAITEALLGYIMPAAFVVRFVVDSGEQ